MLILRPSTAILLVAAICGKALSQNVSFADDDNTELLTPTIKAAPLKDGVCGLPEYINSLPDYAQVELRDLWSTYISGTPCDKELAIQQDVLNVVNTFSRDFVEKNTRENNSVRRSVVPAATTPAEYIDEDLPLPTTTQFPLLIGSEIEMLQKKPSSYIRFDEATIDDIATKRFNNRHATFLHSVPPEVRRKFEKVWNDDDIPSEALRTLKIQTLAVSLLTGKQLEEYNRWATKRRYVLKAREHELRRLSPDAKRTLRRISNRYLQPEASQDSKAMHHHYYIHLIHQHDSHDRDEERIPVSPSVKRELRNFVVAFNRRRTKVLH